MCKKIFAIIMALALILTVAGCGSTGKTTEEGGSTSKNEGDATSLTCDEVLAQIPSNLKGTTIKYFMWYDGRKETEGPVISAFENLTGVKVDVELGSYADFKTELAGKIAAGQSPDVVRSLAPNVSMLKMCQPLSNLNFNFNDAAWDKKTMSDYSINGKCYGTNLVNTLYFDASAIFYNTQVISDYGFEDPYTLWKEGKWTWDKFWEMCQAYVKQGNKYAAYLEQGVIGASMYGVSIMDLVDGKYVNSILDSDRNSKLVKAYSTVLNRIHDNSITPATWTIADFEARRSLFFSTSISAGFKKRSYFSAFKSMEELGAVPMPTGEGYENYTVLSEYSAWCVPQGAPNAEAVPYFLRYMLDIDNYNELELYPDPSMLEVFKSLRSSEKRYCSANDFNDADNGVTIYNIYGRLFKGEVSQINTTLNQFSGNIQDAVDKGNAQYDLMK